MGTRSRVGMPAVLLSVATACGSEMPPIPTPPAALMFAAGTYTFTTTTTGATCVETGTAPASALSIPTTVQQRGADSVFVPTDQPSTFEFWIHRTQTNGADVLVNGQILGSVRISPAVIADFGALGVVSGTTNLTRGNGVIFGQVRFVDAVNNALTCTNLRWTFAKN